MISTGLIQSLLKQDAGLQNKAQSFKPGQVFNGKVIKLFPNQTAEIQVGNQKMIAQLETPLVANERYWFQVQPGEGKVHLKLLTSPDQTTTPTLEGLLKQFSIPFSKSNVDIVQFFIKEQLPITKDNIQLAAEWLKQTDDFSEGLQAIKQMVIKDMPFTKDVFLAAKSTINSSSFQSLLLDLQTALEENSISETGKSLSTLVEKLNMAGSEKVEKQVVLKLLDTWFQGKAVDSKTALKTLQGLGLVLQGSEEEVLAKINQSILSDTSISDKSGFFKADVLKEFLTKQDSSSLKNLLSALHVSMNEPHEEQQDDISSIIQKLAANDFEVTEESKGLITKAWLHSLLEKSNAADNAPQKMMSLINKQVTEDTASLNLFDKIGLRITDSELNLSKLSGLHLGKPEESLLLNLIQEAVEQNNNWDQGEFVTRELKQLFKSVGFSHEHEVLQIIKNLDGSETNKAESLKSLLISFLNENPPHGAKETAEQLLHKITGLQLQSQDIGPIQQYVMQVPLSFWSKTVDLTIQWNGRKQENGQIDPNYCRVLFYLDLEYLHNTVVDMQVQNRIMNINVINDTENIKTLAAPFLKELKSNLLDLGYQLSSVHFQKQVEQESTAAIKRIQPLYDASNYNGVDLRV